MKRVLLLVVIALVALFAFLIEQGVFLAPPEGSTAGSVLHTLFQGGATTALLIIALVLFALLLFYREITRAYRRLRVTASGRVVGESRVENLALSQRFDLTEKALHDFARAMELYAGHLYSHTSAIQGLSRASQELRISAAEQNKVLGKLGETVVRYRVNREISAVERLVDEIERNTERTLRACDFIKQEKPGDVVGEIPVKKPVASPPGCVVNPRALRARMNR